MAQAAAGPAEQVVAQVAQAAAGPAEQVVAQAPAEQVAAAVPAERPLAEEEAAARRERIPTMPGAEEEAVLPRTRWAA